jgi:hypothetical protein
MNKRIFFINHFRIHMCMHALWQLNGEPQIINAKILIINKLCKREDFFVEKESLFNFAAIKKKLQNRLFL